MVGILQFGIFPTMLSKMNRVTLLREILQIAWERFKIIAAIVGDAQARVIATLFYFTILAPFGLLSRSSGDPLNIKASPVWLERPLISNELEDAKRQG